MSSPPLSTISKTDPLGHRLSRHFHPSICFFTKGMVRLWVALAVLAAASLADVAAFAASQPGACLAMAGLFCLVSLKATVLTVLYALCCRNTWLKTLAIAVIVVFSLLSLLNGLCWLFYGFGITMKLFKIMADTNPEELSEFMPELADKLMSMIRSPWLWVGLAIFAAVWKWLPKVPGRLLALGGMVLSGLGLVYLVYVFSTAEFGRTNHLLLARSGRCVAKYMSDRQKIKELQALKRPLPYPESLSSTHAAERIVVVIGESASRDHLSLYGYPLPTTPRLDSIRNDLYIFDDAVASSTSTAENMPRLLTLMTDVSNDKEWYDFPSTLRLFRQLGYRTYWLSNQEYSGQWSNLSSILTADADVLNYVGSMDSEDHYLYRYDDALLPVWEKTLAAKDSLQLTFLHLMGSHFQYYRRFPQSQARFAPQDILKQTPRKWLDDEKAGIVANYDNSILYTDSILSCIIGGVRRLEQPTLLIYLSDHGENVYDDRDFRGRDPKFVEVPFIIYANEAYKKRNPEIMKDIENGRSSSFSTSELPYILMHVSGTRYAMYDSVRDPISKAYQRRKRWVDEELFYRDKPPKDTAK